MTENTSPDNITKWTISDPVSIRLASQALGDSVQAALDNRQRYDFVWADSTERSAQTGMIIGSRGYQLDTKTDYRYDGTNWRLATPHVEFTASQSIPNETVSLVGTLTQDSSKTTDATFVVSTSSGRLTLVDPGLYLVWSTSTKTSGVFGSRTFSQMRDGTDILQRINASDGETISSVSVPGYYSTAPNSYLYLEFFQNTGGAASMNTRIQVTRIA